MFISDQINTPLHAALYSSSTNKVQDVRNTMESIRKTVNAFNTQATIRIKEAFRKSTALHQKVTYQHQRMSCVEMENAALNVKVEKLE